MVFKHSIVHSGIESDSAILVQLMQKSENIVHPLRSLLDGYVMMMSNLQNAKPSHIFRECNMVAGVLAKDSINHDPGLITFVEAPVHTAQAILDDLTGVTRARRTGLCSSS